MITIKDFKNLKTIINATIEQEIQWCKAHPNIKTNDFVEGLEQSRYILDQALRHEYHDVAIRSLK